MLRETLHYLAGSDTLRRTTAHNPLARRLASRFVAGERLDQAVSVVRQVNASGMTASLDHLGENVTSESEARSAAEDYKQILGAIEEAKLQANISCKLTSLGLDLGPGLAMELIGAVVEEAARHDTFVRIDMEGSKYTQATLDITREIFGRSRNVGTVIQSCLYRSENDVRDLNRDGIRVRLVKGAYLEPASIAYPRKYDVDDAYRRIAAQLLQDGDYPAFATHDEVIVEWVKKKARELGRAPESFEFQMLYGIRRDLQRRLRFEGYPVRVYIPYGSQWYPYLMRRLAERPANLAFMLGNLAREAGTR